MVNSTRLEGLCTHSRGRRGFPKLVSFYRHITHRLSTIKSADQIALLENGKIVEHGKHDELMAREEGRYRAFVDAELVGVEAGAGTADE